MRIATYTTVAALALAAAACNSGDQAANDISAEANLAEDAAVNDVLGANAMTDNEAAVALPTDASGFATAVAASDLYEIESGRLAARKGSSAQVKEFAGRLLTDHKKSTADLKDAAAEANVMVNPALDAEKQAMVDHLEAASGAEFDRLFLKQQMTAHQKALTLLQSFARDGDAEPLKTFASKASGLIERHIEHLNGISRPS
jgi:putative membrane protein